MPFHLSGLELVVILVVVLLVFGVGRISKIAGELGSGIRTFREGLSGDKAGVETKDEDKPSQEGKG